MALLEFASQSHSSDSTHCVRPFLDFLRSLQFFQVFVVLRAINCLWGPPLPARYAPSVPVDDNDLSQRAPGRQSLNCD